MSFSGAGRANEVTASDSKHQLALESVHTNLIIARYTQRSVTRSC